MTSAETQPRRALLPRDCWSIVDELTKGFQSGLDAAGALVQAPLQENHIISVERHLVALSVLLSNLRQCISTPAKVTG